MVNSMLEITESEYLIKLNRQNFNLSFIRSLLKMVEVANPIEIDYAEDRFTSRDKVISSEPDYFSSLDEK